MNTAQVTASAALSAAGALSNSGSAVMLSGTMPATPETALSGNTTLCTGTYATTAFGSPSFSGGFMSATGSFTAASYTPVANGACTFVRGYKSDGTTATADYTVGSAWLASTAFAVGQYCTNGGNTYKCVTAGTSASSGGPTGTTAGITDGTVSWDYVGSSTDTWAASTAYTAKQAVVKGSNWYVCAVAGTSASSGGPSGTSNDIVDGTVHWDYAGPDVLFDFLFNNCNLQTGVPVTITQTLKMPAV